MMMSLSDPRRWLLTLPLLATAAIGVFLILAILDPDDTSLPSVLINQPAPGIDLDELPGFPTFGANELAEPGVKIVNYWASWCAPCRAEHPSLLALADMELPVYGVNYKDDDAKAQAFLAELGNPFTGLGTDKIGRVAIDWGVYGIPETFLIDGNGRVLLRHAGPVTSRTLETVVLPAIAEERPSE